MIQKYIISRDDDIYEAFPDIAQAPSGKLVCVFSECNHHTDRSYTRIMLADSFDRGRSWSPKRPLTPSQYGFPFWNCARIKELKDGRLVVSVDRLASPEESAAPLEMLNYLFFSQDEGATWSEAILTPALGIVPDRLLELEDGRWILSCHIKDAESGYLMQRLWFSDDQGLSWNGPVIVACRQGLNLCEASIIQVDHHTLVAFMRENSGKGRDCYKTISHDRGQTWGEPIAFPLPGCHRPSAGFIEDARILLTYRFSQGGAGWGHNLFAALTDPYSILAETREEASTRILPLDFDRSFSCDTGYSGWVKLPDGEIYVVNYIVDDAPLAQIRGYSLRMDDIYLGDHLE
jgi:hypothetical protein